jgi:hypothetical protein
VQVEDTKGTKGAKTAEGPQGAEAGGESSEGGADSEGAGACGAHSFSPRGHDKEKLPHVKLK